MKHIKKLAFGGLLAVSAMAGAQQIRATVNGDTVAFPDVQPTMIGNRVMVPLRGIFEEMGIAVFWDAPSQTVIAKGAGKEIQLPIGSYMATVDGQAVNLDQPAVIRRGRTLVPLRFTAEALDASVNWLAATRTVEIETLSLESPPYEVNPKPVIEAIVPMNTVIPFRMNTRLSSATAAVGDKFVATIAPPNGGQDYQGLPAGSQILGHVDSVHPKEGKTPGVIGLAFDRVQTPDGRTYAIDGSLNGLDNQSVENQYGRLVARPSSRSNNLKYVGYGAGAGVLLSVLGKGNVLTNALIGGALGLLAAEIERDRTKANDVVLESGTRIGVRLNEPLTVYRKP